MLTNANIHMYQVSHIPKLINIKFMCNQIKQSILTHTTILSNTFNKALIPTERTLIQRGQIRGFFFFFYIHKYMCTCACTPLDPGFSLKHKYKTELHIN